MTARSQRRPASFARALRANAAAALAGACIALSPLAAARAATPPPVPADIAVPAGHKLYRVDHAVGTQNYVCLPSTEPPGVAWKLFGPQATLFSRGGRQTATHFLSTDPYASPSVNRATWQDSRDTSAVWAVKREESTDPTFVDPEAIAWLLLQMESRAAGPSGGRRLARTTYIQRIHTAGGRAPATGCTDPAHLGATALVPYSADYLFYKSTEPEE